MQIEGQRVGTLEATQLVTQRRRQGDEGTVGTVGVQPQVLVMAQVGQRLEVDEGAAEAWQSEKDRSGYTYHVRNFRHHDGSPLHVAAARAVDQGGDFAVAVATGLVRDLRPRCLAMSGICAGRRGKVFLGDVIVADVVFRYDVGKLEAYLDDAGERVEEVLPELRAYNLRPRWKRAVEDGPPALAKSVGASRPPTCDAQERWVLDVLADQERGGPAPRDHPGRKDSCPDWKPVLDRLRGKSLVYQRMPLRLTRKGRARVERERHDYPDGHVDPPFKVHVGGLATGDKVIVDEEAFLRLEKVNRSVLGLEREAAAIGLVAAVEDVPRMIIAKGVQDYADQEKDDSMRHFAARASAQFLLAFLRRNLPTQEGATEPRAPSRPTHPAPESGRPEPRFPDDYTRDLSRDLKAAYRRRAEMKDKGQDTADVDESILDLRRKIREGGQLRAGDVLLEGRIELLEPIGHGGFAHVWKGYDEAERRIVAVKVLHGQYVQDRTRRQRFFRGARHMARLNHPGIVRVLEKRCEEGSFVFFVMEYVGGGDLRQAVKAGRLSVEERIRIILDMGEALSFAHKNGVVHRDVKPGNILLDAENRPKLTDFDLVRAADTTGGTRTTGLGTFLYAAPEAMMDAKAASTPADVYGLGMTAVFALHGSDLPSDVLWELPDFVDELEVTEGARKAIQRAVARKVEDRWASVSEFCGALRDGFSAPAPVVTRPEPSAAMKRPEPSAAVAPSEASAKEVRELPDGLKDRSEVFEGIPDRLGDADACLAWVEQLREDNRNGFDLFWLWWIVEEVERRWRPGRRARDLLDRFFDHIPPPEDSELLWAFESPLDGRVTLWREVPAGEGWVGSPENEEGRFGREGPRHRVVMVRPCWLGATPVTNAQYAAFDPGKEFHRWKGVGEDELPSHPRVNVTWYEAVSFCRWLATLRGFAGTAPRLPVEEEWEVACRAGTSSRFWRGDSDKDLRAVGWFTGNAGGRIHRVGSKPANGLGLYDVHGNVWEWTASPWDEKRYEGRSKDDAHRIEPSVAAADLAAPPRVRRVVRGGGYRGRTARDCRSAYRDGWDPGVGIGGQGFRVLLSSAPSRP